MVLSHYLPEAAVERLRRVEPLADTLSAQQRTGRGALWIVAPAPSHAFRTNLEEGGLITWMYENCQLQKMMGVGRVDYRQEYLQVYRCPPSMAEGTRHLGV
jgi:hypothetical protein